MSLPLLERAIAAVAPGWAERRAVARRNLSLLTFAERASSSGAGINDQASRTAQSHVGTVDEDVENNRETDLLKARSLMARNSWARGAVNSIVGNVIGRGMSAESDIKIQSRARKGLPDTPANQAVEERFLEWSRHCDISGSRSLKAIQRQAYGERWVAGEVLIRKHIVPDRGEIPLALEVTAGELLSDRTEGSVKQGIEFDPNGVPIRYFFRKSEDSSDEIAVPAANVIHYFKPHRPGAVRGLSPLAVVETSFEALRRYLNHELTRAAIASAFVALHKTGGAGIRGLATGRAGDRTDSTGNSLIQVLDGGGMLLQGGPTDSLESVAPAIQSTAFDPFVRLVLRSIATGLGISYERLARDFSQSNYSSERASTLEDRRQWEPEQEDFTDQVLMRIWDWFIDAAQVARVNPFTVRRRVWPVNWMPQGWLWVDPEKDGKALSLACQLGVDNVIDASRRQGRDFYENVRKKAEAERYAEEQGTQIGEAKEQQTDVNDQDEAEEASAPSGPSATGKSGGSAAAA